jgi:hypothetical protein
VKHLGEQKMDLKGNHENQVLTSGGHSTPFVHFAGAFYDLLGMNRLIKI